MSARQLSRHMEAVARHLLGEPNKGLSSKTELRFGKRGSLSVDLTKGTFYDHERGEGGGVLDLIARETGHANGAAVDWMRETLGVEIDAKPNGEARKPFNIVATYDYVSEDGELLFQVCRLAPKDFRQRRPSGSGGWIWGVKGIEPVPYRLPEVIAAETVFIPEGEKDADNLARLGLTATCNPGGAGKWPADFARYIAGKHVVILPDNDDAGRQHAKAVARNLLPVAMSLKLVELPGLPDKGDVSDWLEAGGTVETLRELVEAAPAKAESNAFRPKPREDDAEIEGDDEWKGALLAAIEEMNRRYFVAMVGGKGVIARMVFDEARKRDGLVFSAPRDIKLRFNNRHYKVGVGSKGKDIFKDLGTAWIEHPYRRTYDRLALIPKGEVPDDVYNLWRGWGVEPKPGAWPRIDAHLKEVICSGNTEHYDYLLRWMAYCVQHPDKPAEVCPVLKGDKGTGKSMFGTMLRRMFGAHAIQVSHPRHVTGNFNAHLADTLMLVVNEAFWAGDKAADSVLKNMITDETIPIERKGLDVIEMPNRLKMVLLTNNDWAVPATADERRYFVLRVSAKRKGDYDYFRKLAEAIDGEEMGALLRHLLDMDLSGHNHREVPNTDELNEQKLLGADTLTKFWHSCLWAGGIVGTEYADDWPKNVVIQLLYAAYVDYSHALGNRHPVNDTTMSKELQKFWPGGVMRIIRPRAAHEGGPRPKRYVLESLEEHRIAFLKGMNIDPDGYKWPAVEGDVA